MRDVRLVTPSDPGYRAYMDRLTAESFTLRAKLPPTAAWLVSGIAERAVRAWLAPRAGLTDRRILAYRQRGRGYDYVDAYHELDAVAWDAEAEAPTVVYEIKCSRNPKSVAKATGQLCRAVALLRRQWPNVKACALFVDFTEERWHLDVVDEAGVEASAEPGREAGDGLPAAGRAEDRVAGEAGRRTPAGLHDIVRPPGRAGTKVTWWIEKEPGKPIARATGTPDVLYVLLDSDWVRDLAAEQGLLTDPDLWERARTEVPEEADVAGEAPTYSDGDDLESPLAAALKKAGL